MIASLAVQVNTLGDPGIVGEDGTATTGRKKFASPKADDADVSDTAGPLALNPRHPASGKRLR